MAVLSSSAQLLCLWGDSSCCCAQWMHKCTVHGLKCCINQITKLWEYIVIVYVCGVYFCHFWPAEWISIDSFSQIGWRGTLCCGFIFLAHRSAKKKWRQKLKCTWTTRFDYRALWAVLPFARSLFLWLVGWKEKYLWLRALGGLCTLKLKCRQFQ
jgi:hypothetical protein